MLNLRSLVKFSLMVGLFDILFDASLGHALIWRNDPYWTYWITKTFLIITIFAVGSAIAGIGAKQGAVISLVHTIILTVYYWTFSPVGLPKEVMWLDIHHTWTTGVPIHFLVIYIGYLASLWLWRNLRTTELEPKRAVGVSLLYAAGSVIVLGIASSLILGQFVGVTWFITRVLVLFPFFLLWITYMPLRNNFIWFGAFAWSLVLVNYSHYLSPLGLPGTWRLFSTENPITNPYWLSFGELWYKEFPICFVILLCSLWLLSKNRSAN